MQQGRTLTTAPRHAKPQHMAAFDMELPAPPRARLFGGDRPRGGTPAGVGHAGRSGWRVVPALFCTFLLTGLLALGICAIAARVAGLPVSRVTASALTAPAHLGDEGAAEQVREQSAPSQQEGALGAMVRATADGGNDAARDDRAALLRPLSPLLDTATAWASSHLARSSAALTSANASSGQDGTAVGASPAMDEPLAMRVAAAAGAALAVLATVASINAKAPARRRATPRRRA